VDQENCKPAVNFQPASIDVVSKGIGEYNVFRMATHDE